MKLVRFTSWSATSTTKISYKDNSISEKYKNQQICINYFIS